MNHSENHPVFRAGRAWGTVWLGVGVSLLAGILIGVAGCRHTPHTTVFHVARVVAQRDPTHLADQVDCGHCKPDSKTPDPWDFPASFHSNQCTAELIGTHVLMTAAHCVFEPDNGASQARVIIDDPQLPSGQNPYTGLCSHAPGDIDIALCAMDGEPPVPLYETVSFGDRPLSLGQQLLLGGFGCCNKFEDNGLQYVAVFGVGFGTVHSLPDDEAVLTTQQGAINCTTDSGSGLFVVDTTPGSQPGRPGSFQKRVIVGVAATVDNGPTPPISSFTSTEVPAVRDFFNAWQAQNQLKICGLASDAGGCR